MNKHTLLRQLPIALVVVTAGIGIAQSATTGRVFPYVGYLEENGFPVDGERDMRINLYTAPSGGNACQTVSFDGVTVANGRFKVDIEDVDDGCLIAGELYASLSVGPLGGQLTDLSTGEGAGRVMIGAVPFAAAGPKAATFFTDTDADIGRHLIVGSNATVGGSLGVGTGVTAGGNVSAASNVTAGGNISASGDVTVGDDLFVQQGARFNCTGCGAEGTFDGTYNWGILTVQGRVLSGNNNIHLSPPSGSNVIINDTYRAAGGASGGTPVGLVVQGNASTRVGSVPGGNEQLYIVRGTINGNGTINRGTGFTASRVGAGLYDVTFNPAFSGAPTVMCSGHHPTTGNATGGYTHCLLNHQDNVTASGTRIVVTDGNGSRQDWAVSFIAMGPR